MTKYEDFTIESVFHKVKTVRLPYKAGELAKTKDSNNILPVLTAGINNQGLSGYVPIEGATVLKNVISVSANGANTGVMFYQPDDFTILQDSYAIEYSGSETIGENEYLFMVSCLETVIKPHHFDWSNKAGWEKIRKLTFKLPVADGKIDFEYMRSYIKELKRCRIKDLNVYLKVTGLSDYDLTEEEKQAVHEMREGTKQELFRIGDIFKQERGKETAPNQVLNGCLPMINEISTNNGVSKQASSEYIISKNAITISVNYAKTVFYQPDDFCASVNILVLRSERLTPLLAMYFVTLLKQNNTQYDYCHKISKDRLNNTQVLLPVITHGKPNYMLMETYMRAQEKITIANVVKWCKKEIDTAERC
jgi:hypothetical protein